MEKRRGQIWIETVIYTLIGLALIALVLSYVMPKINEMKDNALVEQSVSAMESLHDKIGTIRNKPGSTKVVEFTLKKGELLIDSTNNSISLFISDLSAPYSEPGVEVEIGSTKIVTIQNQKAYDVNIKISYPALNLTFNGVDSFKKIDSSSAPYKFAFSNKGSVNGKYNVDIKQV